ncbi:MAG: hypothetical protein ACSLFK_09090 [Gemmatimonadaceae bacterium]
MSLLRLFHTLAVVVAPAVASTIPVVLPAQQPSGRDVVERAEKALWGTTLQGRFTMTVATPRWRRTLELQVWIDRPRRSFIRILSPAKEAGIASLRISSEMMSFTF